MRTLAKWLMPIFPLVWNLLTLALGAIQLQNLLWEKVTTMKTLRLETDYKIELPPDWVAELGLESGIVLERTHNGILIRPYPTQTWDEIYAEKLKIGSASVLDLSEVSGDDLVF